MKTGILSLLKKDARISVKSIAEQLGCEEELVLGTIKELEDANIIRGYQTLIDDSYVSENAVRAIIEVKTRPEREGGFDRIACRLSKFPEVSALYLVSGGYDLQLEVHGENLQEVANFVSSKLATIEGVNSTATHFILKKYKENGIILQEGEGYEKLKVSP